MELITGITYLVEQVFRQICPLNGFNYLRNTRVTFKSIFWRRRRQCLSSFIQWCEDESKASRLEMEQLPTHSFAFVLVRSCATSRVVFHFLTLWTVCKKKIEVVWTEYDTLNKGNDSVSSLDLKSRSSRRHYDRECLGTGSLSTEKDERKQLSKYFFFFFAKV